MKLIEYIGLSFLSIARHPLRSSLTILGIVIGVGAVVSMVSVSDGSRAMVLREIERTGGLNVIEIYKDEWDKSSGTISRAASRTVRKRWRRNRVEDLETPDADALVEKVAGVTQAVPEDEFGGCNLNYDGKSRPASIIASTKGYDDLRNWHVAIGRFLSENDNKKSRSVTVIGWKLYEELFEGEDPIGKKIKATRPSNRRRGGRFDVRLTVIGVMEEKGNSMDTEGWDEKFIIPISTLQERFKGRKHIERIRVSVEDLDYVEDVRESAKTVIGRIHRTDGDAYQYWTAKEELTTAETVGRTMKTVMGLVAGIALIVAGIGVMNIMLVSVTERTREIGLRKAIGAKRSDILIQFLIESSVLTLTGGIIGAILGIFMGKGFAILISKFVWEGSDWPAIISVEAILIAIFVSVAVGLFFGIYPANRAAKLTPIEALRSE